MKVNIRLPKTKLLIASLFLFYLFFIHQSCTKLDTSVTPGKGFTDAQATQKFFLMPAGTDPLVRKIAMQLSRQNDATEFISAFAKNEGYAIWDKAQLKVKRNATVSFQGNINAPDNDSTLIIPLVLENTELVNGYLEATISDSISILEYRRSGYTNHPFSTGPNDERYTAEKYQVQMMALDRAVFGDTVFKVLDPRLFIPFGHPIQRSVRHLHLQDAAAQAGGSGLMGEEAECQTIYTYDCDLHEGPSCPYAVLVSITIYCSGGSGGGSGNPVGGITPGAGTSPGGGGGGGTAPVQPPLWNPNPCQLIDSLMKIPSFKDSVLTRLKDSVNTDHEVGYDWINPQEDAVITPIHWGGGGGIVQDVAWGGKRDGFAHSHDSSANNLNIFSNEDLGKLYEIYKSKKMRKPTQFVLPLVTKTTSYILVINDTAAFGNFGRTFLNTAFHVKRLGDFIYREDSDFKVNKDSSVTANAVHFMQGLKALNPNMCGMKLFMGTGRGNISKYIPVGEYNGTLVQAPCQ